MAVTWRTLPNGQIEVAGEGVRLPSAEAQKRLDEVWSKWHAFILSNATRTGIPATWIGSVIRVESNGDPKAKGADGEAGLMQIMPAGWKGHTREQMEEPGRNIAMGSDILRDRRNAMGAKNGSLPRVASAYNCGTSSSGFPIAKPETRWGMCSSPGYIDLVTEGSNYLIARYGAGAGKGALPSTPATSHRLLRIGDSLTVGLASSGALGAELPGVTLVGSQTGKDGGHEGHGGRGIAWLRERTDKFLFDAAPLNTIVLWVGSNDLTRPVPTILADLRPLAMRAAQSARLILVTLPPGTYRSLDRFELNAGIRRMRGELVAEGYDVGPIADVERALLPSDVAPDGIHIQPSAYSKVARSIAVAVKGTQAKGVSGGGPGLLVLGGAAILALWAFGR